MGFLKKIISKAKKSIKKAVKKINPLAPIESIISISVEKGLGEIVSPALDILGLKSFSNEVDRWSEDLGQVNKTLSGQYSSAQKDLATAQERYENALDKYEDNYEKAANQYNTGLNSLLEEMDSLFAFHEIFKMSAANDLKNYGEFVTPDDYEVQQLYKRYKELASRLKSEYDFIISLRQGGIMEKALHSMITVAGGIVSDMRDIADGEANGEAWKKIVSVIIAVILVIIAILAAIPTGGASLSLISVAIAILTVVSTLLMLDSMYGGGSLMESIFDMFDFLFNDLMNLDDLIGSDFDKFDSDNEDYQEMTMYFKMAIAISTIILSLGSSAAGGNTGTNMWTDAKTGMTGYASSTFGLSVEAGILGTSLTYADLYNAYSTAMAVNDYIEANDKYETLKGKLNEDLGKVNNIIVRQTNKNFMKHYKDVKYMLNDQQEYIDRYIYSMTAENMYVDPYGTTPVANMRFEPDKDIRVLVYGFEDIFDESKMAGSKSYFNEILYG